MSWSISEHQKPTDRQPNREYRRLQLSVERDHRDFWLRVGAIGVTVACLIYLAAEIFSFS